MATRFLLRIRLLSTGVPNPRAGVVNPRAGLVQAPKSRVPQITGSVLEPTWAQLGPENGTKRPKTRL